MKVIDRVKEIEGVDDAFYNFNDLSMTVFLKNSSNVDSVKHRVINELNLAGLWGYAIEKIKFYM